MDFFLISAVSFAAAALALLSGFGLGTILTPAFAFFYDVKTAVFLVAVVHLLNNLLKLGLFWKSVDWNILKRFGVLAVIGAFVGAFGQVYLQSEWLRWFLGFVLIMLGIKEWVPERYQFKFPKAIDPIGGFFSGLLGGLVGNQGAIRSAFLLSYKISKETFIATGVVLACLIDLTRIPVYWASYAQVFSGAWKNILFLIGITFAGTFFGKTMLKHVSLEHFRKFVAGVIVVMGVYFLF